MENFWKDLPETGYLWLEGLAMGLERDLHSRSVFTVFFMNTLLL